MKCLPLKTYTVKFNRVPNWNDAGFVNNRFQTDQVRANVSIVEPSKVFIRSEPQHFKRIIDRIRRSARNCQVKSRTILTRNYEIKIPFYYDSIATLRFALQRPQKRDRFHTFDHVSQRFVNDHQIIRILSVRDKEDAEHKYINKILPVIKDYKIPKHEAMRIQFVKENASTYERIIEMHEQIVIRGRECDRCLALVDAFQDGDHAIMFRVLGFLY